MPLHSTISWRSISLLFTVVFIDDRAKTQKGTRLLSSRAVVKFNKPPSKPPIPRSRRNGFSLLRVDMKEPLTRADRVVIFRIVAIYAFFSALWVYLSDEVVAFFNFDPACVLHISIFKGLLFITLTSFLLTHLIARHIRASRKAERDLLESEGRYRQLVENSPDGILIEDGTVFTYANPAALSLLAATTPEQIIGKPGP